MSGVLFPNMPSMPAMQAAPAPEAVTNTGAVLQSERLRQLRKRGRASTILAGDYLNDGLNPAAKTLLGQ